MITKLCETTRKGTVFERIPPSGNQEEHPVSAAVFIEALGAEFQNTRARGLINSIRSAADWFLGANRVNVPLYDFSTGGCYDALTASGVNRNQGTKASLYCLLAFLTLHRLAAVDDGADAGKTPS